MDRSTGQSHPLDLTEDPNGVWDPVRDDDSPNDDFSVEGTRLRMMWDEGAGPLWGDEGLLPAHPEWLRQALGLTDALIADLIMWVRDMDSARDRGQSQDLLNPHAQRLTERLQAEVGARFRVRFHA